jgi:hypothetical protein
MADDARAFPRLMPPLPIGYCAVCMATCVQTDDEVQHVHREITGLYHDVDRVFTRAEALALTAIGPSAADIAFRIGGVVGATVGVVRTLDELVQQVRRVTK